MKKSISKKDVEKQIESFFLEIKKKTSEDIKKIKRLAMSYKIKLGEKRKLFCKKCLMPYKNPKIRIKNKTKIVICENCGFTARWKIK